MTYTAEQWLEDNRNTGGHAYDMLDQLSDTEFSRLFHEINFDHWLVNCYKNSHKERFQSLNDDWEDVKCP